MSRTMNRRGPSFLTGLGAGAPMLVGLYGVMWALEIVDLALGHSLDSFGIRPRTVEGLLCIPLAPFLHFGCSATPSSGCRSPRRRCGARW